MKLPVVIVIPIYKKTISHAEECSLKQCAEVFSGRHIAFVYPRGLDLDNYKALFRKVPTVMFKPFPAQCFENISSYNKMLLGVQFYKTFDAYEYILIYQTDAFVFSDQLDSWLKKGYHYVGSPIVLKAHNDNLEFLPFGGNGGFSLRHVKAHLNVLKKNTITDSPSAVMAYHRQFHKGLALILRAPLMVARFLGFRNNSRFYIRQFSANEDMFWSKKAMTIDKKFKPAPASVEIAFAFEKYPSTLFEMNSRMLPFGCHAWEKYEPEFWKQFIPGA
ncbi:MAG TPA: DUF5672 family protein [Flavobacteriales bacterium]|nr:DUF5672 family protein [Flavobacteriales bacterium]